MREASVLRYYSNEKFVEDINITCIFIYTMYMRWCIRKVHIGSIPLLLDY